VHFLAFAEEGYPNLTGSPKEWLDRLEAEHDNFRAALDEFARSGETQQSLALAGALWKFWYQRGYPVEGRQRLELALAADDSPTAARARALNGATGMAGESGDTATARQWGDEALALHRRLGDQWGIANSVFMLGHVAADARDWARAQELFEDSARAFGELGDEHYLLLANQNLAWVCYELGDFARTDALNEDSLRRARAVGNRRIEAGALVGLSWIARDEGRLEDVRMLLAEAYGIHRDLGERVEVADDLSALARVLAVAGKAGTAARLLARSAALTEEIGASQWWTSERNEETLTTIRLQLDDAAFAEAWEEGRRLTLDEAVALALETELDA
jgi:tetratricopeptide (TPR) repeat protein